jgi:hypothetical protein
MTEQYEVIKHVSDECLEYLRVWREGLLKRTDAGCACACSEDKVSFCDLNINSNEDRNPAYSSKSSSNPPEVES